MLQAGKKYKLVFIVNGHALTYPNALVLEIDNEMGFITFQDRYNELFTYNLNQLSSLEEISNGNN